MLQTHYLHTTITTSAHLAQTMTLLSLTSTELQQKIESELANNPALELINERRCPMCKRLLPQNGNCPICSQPSDLTGTEPIVFISPREDFYYSNNQNFEDISDDPFSSESVDLPTFVLRQIAPELNPGDRLVAAYILTHLDEDGFLTINSYEIARYHHRQLSEIDAIIDKLKRCEPVGVCSKGPKEALLIQVEVLSESVTVPKFTREVIENGLDELSHHHYAELGRKLGISTIMVSNITNFVADNLNPFPGRASWGDVRNPNENSSKVYHKPDVLIYHLNENPINPLVVEIIHPIRGTLQINPLFKQAIKQADEDKIQEWKGDLDRASLLIKCVQQRSNALKMLLEKLVTYQRDFILLGEKHMNSLTRAELAKELGVHESTISRAVSSKTIQLPNKRIVPMSIFFDRSLSFRCLIKEIIENETKPLSDSDLQEILKEKGIDIARRTIAKYRSMEGILPAYLRQSNLEVAN